MSDNLSKSSNSKCRRGARAIKKITEPTVNDVSKILTSVLSLSTEPQTTPPRRPKLSKKNNDFVSKNSEIHQMVVESNILQILPNKNHQWNKKKIRAVETPKILAIQTQEILSVQTQNIRLEENPEIVSQTTSVQIIQNEIAPNEPAEISGRMRSRRKWKKNKNNNSTNDSEGASKSDRDPSKDPENAKANIEKNENDKFPPTVPEKEVRELLENQPKDNPSYIEGNIRINVKYSKHAYLSMPGAKMDILIIGVRDRNRALEGDLVVANINSEDKWFKHPTGEVQKTGVVVCILEKVHPRKTIGCIKEHQNGVIFYPRDIRTPLLRIINPQRIPATFYQNPDAFKDILFLADIAFWRKPKSAFGKLQKAVGSAGDLRVETSAILLENDLDVNPFADRLLRGLPPINYIPTASDLEGREDWRNRCVFTIDPATAVDLDDAVSCTFLDNGNYEVSVHISDVTHYLEAFTPLDNKVSDRATTVYLVDNVYHMLPMQLCQVCSLLPGQDKLAFSVIWEMTPTAEVINHRFTKTVINSCFQMTYGQAQAMIENPFNDWSKEPSLNIKGNFEASQMCEVVNNLYKLSLQMRERRFAGGALRIDQPKLYISLDRETGIPVSCSIEEHKESNRLIEEFMLLANMTVAKYLYENLPETALLRSHKEPSIRVLTQTRDMLEKFGVILNIESAGTLQMSLSQYETEVIAESTENFAAKCRMMVINSLCAKSMTRAVYRCSNSVKEEEGLRHYALNVPLYTHFTSPIRRYSDCIVHRLLYASITNVPLPPKWNSFLCAKLASNCNVKKYSAKVAQGQSTELFFTYLLDLSGPTNTQAVVMDVKNRSIDVIIIDIGIKVRIYIADVEEEVTAEFSVEHSVPTIKLTWKGSELKQVINVFSIVDVRIQKHPSLFRLHGVLLPRSSNIMNKIL